MSTPAEAIRHGVETNIIWCDAICRAAGLPTSRSAEVWTVASRSPENYPDAVTLRPGLGAAAVLAGVDDGPGCSVKDSFCDVDLAASGFATLFEASWIVRSSSGGRPRRGAAPADGWEELTTTDGIGRWLAARGIDVASERLRDVAAVRLFSSAQSGAGFALTGTDSAVGLSSVTHGSTPAEASWAEVIAIAEQQAAGRVLVGYESGSELADARRCGFAVAGPLRVWLRP